MSSVQAGVLSQPAHKLVESVSGLRRGEQRPLDNTGEKTYLKVLWIQPPLIFIQLTVSIADGLFVISPGLMHCNHDWGLQSFN